MTRLVLVILVACGGASSTGSGESTVNSSGSSSRDATLGSSPVSGDATLDRELATMRAHDQKVWNPSSGPAMDAARDVFDKIDFVGKTDAELTAMIGAPMKIDAGVWQYYFHNGEMGVVRWFHFDHGRVARVQVVMTQ